MEFTHALTRNSCQSLLLQPGHSWYYRNELQTRRQTKLRVRDMIHNEVEF